MTSIVFIVILFLLAVGTYLTKRRFGLLGLGLVAGSVLSIYATGPVMSFLQNQDLSTTILPFNILVGICLIILPVLLLFLVGPTYKSKTQRIVCALATSFAGGLFVLLYIKAHAPDLLVGIDVVQYIAPYQGLFVVIIIIVALADAFHGHFPKNRKLK